MHITYLYPSEWKLTLSETEGINNIDDFACRLKELYQLFFYGRT